MIWCFEGKLWFTNALGQPPVRNELLFVLTGNKMTQSFTAACQNECQSSLNWLFAGLMTIQGPEGTEGWGMPEDAGCWWVAVAFENEFLSTTIHFGTVDACWCEDLWTSFSAIQAPWLPLGLVYWILLSYAFLHLVALEKGLYKRWPFAIQGPSFGTWSLSLKFPSTHHFHPAVKPGGRTFIFPTNVVVSLRNCQVDASGCFGWGTSLQLYIYYTSCSWCIYVSWL